MKNKRQKFYQWNFILQPTPSRKWHTSLLLKRMLSSKSNWQPWIFKSLKQALLSLSSCHPKNFEWCVSEFVHVRLCVFLLNYMKRIKIFLDGEIHSRIIISLSFSVGNTIPSITVSTCKCVFSNKCFRSYFEKNSHFWYFQRQVKWR